MSEVAPELTEQIGQLLHRTGELKAQLEEKGADTAAINAQLDEVTQKVAKLDEERTERENEAAAKATTDRISALEAQMASFRTPSKAAAINRHFSSEPDFGSYFATVALAQNPRLAGGPEGSAEAKARLDEMGSRYEMPDPASKATLGDTDAAGGYLIPNNVVADINLQATAGRDVVDLFTNINGVRGSAVDIPWEQETISRAVIAAYGATKENSAFIVNNYTATLYTLARIFDVGNQLLRHSAGAAEQLVRSKLARAFALGEDWYALNGTGSSQPYGLLTALGTSGTYVTSHTSSDSTVAGSVFSAISKAAGVLEDRGAVADAVVLNTANWWQMLRQGGDSAGFWSAPSVGPTGVDPTRPSMTIWGLTARKSPNMPSDSLVVGEYKSATFFRGQGYRVDTSSEAGDRWDKNLTGFRGEEEIAFDARPAVYTGHFQRITDVIP